VLGHAKPRSTSRTRLIVGDAASTTFDSLTYIEHIRLLCCEFEIQTNSQDVIKGLSYIAQRAEQDVPLVQRCTVTITWTGDEYRISGDGMEEDFELSVTSALETVCQRLHNHAIAALPDHIRISAASGIHAEHAFLIIGPEGAGKTTLALSLMMEGVDITGDALVLLRDREALPFPRKFHAREDSIGRIPTLRTVARFAACVSNPQEGRLMGLDPLEFGKPWRIAPVAVSTIFYIEPNHGARTTLLPCGKVEMIRRMLPLCAPPVSGRPGWLGDICATVNQAGTFVVELGDLDSAMLAMLSVLG
jgi:hypothetical protein